MLYHEVIPALSGLCIVQSIVGRLDIWLHDISFSQTEYILSAKKAFYANWNILKNKKEAYSNSSVKEFYYLIMNSTIVDIFS